MNLVVVDGNRRLFWMSSDSQQPPSPLERLTARELQIANLISRGLEGKEIAHRLRISENTIAHHRKNIFRKLGVPNASAMTRKIVENETAAKHYKQVFLDHFRGALKEHAARAPAEEEEE